MYDAATMGAAAGNPLQELFGSRPSAPPPMQPPASGMDLLSLLASIAGTAGDVLDTPGALLRGVLSGDPGSRASGRDMLEAWGVIGENDPNQWEAGDIAGGLATAIVDPLALAGLAAPAALATKGGRAAASGMLRKIPGVANPWDDVLRAEDPGLLHNLGRLPNAVKRGLGFSDEVPIGYADPFNNVRTASGEAAMRLGKGMEFTPRQNLMDAASTLDDAAPAMARRDYLRQALAADAPMDWSAMQGTAPRPNMASGATGEPMDLFGLQTLPGNPAVPRATMSRADIADLVGRAGADRGLLARLGAFAQPLRQERASIARTGLGDLQLDRAAY